MTKRITPKPIVNNFQTPTKMKFSTVLFALFLLGVYLAFPQSAGAQIIQEWNFDVSSQGWTLGDITDSKGDSFTGWRLFSNGKPLAAPIGTAVKA